jgi:hypothetical protein
MPDGVFDENCVLFTASYQGPKHNGFMDEKGKFLQNNFFKLVLEKRTKDENRDSNGKPINSINYHQKEVT